MTVAVGYDLDHRRSLELHLPTFLGVVLPAISLLRHFQDPLFEEARILLGGPFALELVAVARLVRVRLGISFR